MKTLNLIILVGIVLGTFHSQAAAQDRFVVYDRERGELSQGAAAPSRDEMVQAIQSAAPSRLVAVLEYGERVECHECVPLLQHNLLNAGDARVREISAWWLRRRLWGYGAILNSLRNTLATDADATRRSRAAEALGNFLDPTNVRPLRERFGVESEAVVRASIVRAVARINAPSGHDVLVAGFADPDPAVRTAAVQTVLRANFFSNYDAILPLLADSQGDLRRRAALVLGSFGVTEAVSALAGLLRSDTELFVRQAAAWALGRIGGAEARSALDEARGTETESLVIDAIEVARRM